MPPLIIPLFIPNRGCPHRCVFCNQKKSSGNRESFITLSYLVQQVNEWLSYDLGNRDGTEIAFFGGTFTGLPLDIQENFLSGIYQFVESGRVDSVRISTRPDTLTQANLSLLSRYAVKTVELGVQSMDNTILERSGRGHTASDVFSAVTLLRENRFKIGIQLMPGLPGDTLQTALSSARKVLELKPDFVRIYPTVVIRETLLYKSYKKDEFCPLTLKQGVEWCAKLLILFKKSKTRVIRLGLQSTPSLELKGEIVAGPYHPAFRQLVESKINYMIMQTVIKKWGVSGKKILFRVPERELSNYIGQKSDNIKKITKKQMVDIRIEPVRDLKEGTLRYNDGEGFGKVIVGLDLI